MKINVLKLSLVVILQLFMCIELFAQTQTLCVHELETYTVDETDPSNSGSYTWSLTDTSANDYSSSIINQGDNQISVDWSDNTVFSVGETYTLTVVEQVNGCDGPEQTLLIELILGYLAPSFATVNAVCSGENTNFILEGGTLDATVTYEIESDLNGIITGPTTINLDAVDTNANPTFIPVPSLNDPNVTEVFTLRLISIDDDGSDSCDILNIDTNNTADITVNPAPTTTPINYN